MKKSTQYHLLCSLAFIAIFFLASFIVSLIFPELEYMYRAIISGIISVIFAPRVEKGENPCEKQIRWIFLKSPKVI